MTATAWVFAVLFALSFAGLVFFMYVLGQAFKR